MHTFLIFLIIGLTTGAIYAVAATGLVVTYTTSRVFNFAHGALGMFIAFAYYTFHVSWHLPTPLALAIALLVLAPAMGVFLDVVVMRRLQAASVALRLVVTLALFTVLQGGALLIWGTTLRSLPPLLGNHSFSPISGLNVTFDQGFTVAVAVVVAGGLWLLFHKTRLGTTMRAVVDDPVLAELNGIDPGRVTSFSWAMGTSLAGLAAILIAPGLSLNIQTLSLLVVSAYAAAIVGRLSSLAWTFVGGIGLGVLSQLLVGYLPGTNQIVQDLGPALPFIVLFIMLVVLRQERATLQRVDIFREPPPPRLRNTLMWTAAGVAITAAVSPALTTFESLVFGTALVYASILLSLVLITGVSGQVSVAQFSFVGLGAVLVSHLTPHMPYVLAVVVTIAVSGLVGALVALPALRLRGLYLALSTLAFAVLMDSLVFPNSHVIPSLSQVVNVAPPNVFGHFLRSDRSQLPLLALVMSLFGVGVLAVRRGRFGRALSAMRDAPVSASALGMNLVRYKVVIFAASAAMAGLAGIMFGGLQGTVSPHEFTYLSSLAALLILAIQGFTSVTGAMAGAVFYALVFLALPQWITNPNTVQAIQPFLIGLGIINVALHPEGAVAQNREQFRAMRAKMRARRAEPVAPSGALPVGGR
jgi:branched-chain amino acid transport system permease protein